MPRFVQVHPSDNVAIIVDPEGLPAGAVFPSGLALTVDYAVRRIKAELLPKFPNVDDAIAITHTYGCGVAIDAPGAAIPIRTLRHISSHANIGGVPLIVSLGCEKMQPSRLFPERLQLPVLENDPYLILLQDQHLRGFGAMVS